MPLIQMPIWQIEAERGKLDREETSQISLRKLEGSRIHLGRRRRLIIFNLWKPEKRTFDDVTSSHTFKEILAADDALLCF